MALLSGAGVLVEGPCATSGASRERTGGGMHIAASSAGSEVPGSFRRKLDSSSCSTISYVGGCKLDMTLTVSADICLSRCLSSVSSSSSRSDGKVKSKSAMWYLREGVQCGGSVEESARFAIHMGK
jgi:hypothetical protein